MFWFVTDLIMDYWENRSKPKTNDNGCFDNYKYVVVIDDKNWGKKECVYFSEDKRNEAIQFCDPFRGDKLYKLEGITEMDEDGYLSEKEIEIDVMEERRINNNFPDKVKQLRNLNK